MKAANYFVSIFIIGAIFSIAGCGGGGLRHVSGYPGTTGSPYSPNEALAQRVHTALAADARVGVSTLTIKVVDGVVELGGNPKDLQARDLALWITTRVSGVRSVLNNMVMN